jgi:hypothetical protein
MASSDRTLGNYFRYEFMKMTMEAVIPKICIPDAYHAYSSIWSTWNLGLQPRLCGSCPDASHLEGGPYPSRSCQLLGGLSSGHNPLRLKQIQAHSIKFMEIHAKSCKFMQMQANSSKFKQIESNSSKFKQFQAN